MSKKIALCGEVVIDSTNKWIDFTYGVALFAVSITEQTYDDVRAVWAAMMAAIETATGDPGCWEDSGDGVRSTGKVIIGCDDDLELHWKTGVHGADNADDHIGHVLGFSDAADDTGAARYTSDYQHLYGWYSNSGIKSDSKTREKQPGSPTRIPMAGTDGRRTTWNSGAHQVRELSIQLITAVKFFADEADTNEAFETWWLYCNAGKHFKYYTDTTDFAGTDQGIWIILSERDADLLAGIQRLAPGEEYYDVKFVMQKMGT